MRIYNSFDHPKYEFSHQNNGFSSDSSHRNRAGPVDPAVRCTNPRKNAAEKWGTWKYLENMLYTVIKYNHH